LNSGANPFDILTVYQESNYNDWFVEGFRGEGRARRRENLLITVFSTKPCSPTFTFTSDAIEMWVHTIII
jgi:hypothetical protein